MCKRRKNGRHTLFMNKIELTAMNKIRKTNRIVVEKWKKYSKKDKKINVVIKTKKQVEKPFNNKHL